MLHKSPLVTGTQTDRIHYFVEKLYASEQARDTTRKITYINGYVKTNLDKLPGIGANLGRLDDNLEDWGFRELTEALRKWTERNPEIFNPEKTTK